MINFFDFTFKQFQDFLVSKQQKPYRATQIFNWVYKKGVTDFDFMTDLNKGFAGDFKDLVSFNLPEVIVQEASSDETIKVLFRLSDGLNVEAVLMKYNYGNSVCVSSQAGCDQGCVFCASGLLKKVRNLTVSEMVAPLVYFRDLLAKKGETVSHVVVMGTGEPFDNYDNLISFLTLINDPKAFEIGARHISVSTCGLVPRINDFAHFPLQVNLAISLHAPNDEIRNILMPINKIYPIKELIAALKSYIKKTNRRVTLEYLLIKDLNDSLLHAQELVRLIRHLNVYVNLIPYNEVQEKRLKRSSSEAIRAFYHYLHTQKINVTIRKEFGKDINAACGQLRAKYVEKNHLVPDDKKD
jgi:23S rRNA (adenine2503-C2)-methyltransferase